jgi:hypothetical protein
MVYGNASLLKGHVDPARPNFSHGVDDKSHGANLAFGPASFKLQLQHERSSSAPASP